VNVLLISTYELGRQPFGLASPAAWLRARGARVACLDLSREPLAADAVESAELVAFYVPMHTATRLAVELVPVVRRLNPRAHLCFYGLYAPVNEGYLRALGVGTILGGEFEASLVRLVERLEAAGAGNAAADGPQPEPVISLARQRFLVPDRAGLPPLARYARLVLPTGEERVVGATEASRGCKHLCRHCPIVPVYHGVFRIVERDVVLADVRRQAEAGARHITFGDPDFFNGPRHAVELVRAFHRAFPGLTYDVTIKVEHLIRHHACLPVLRDTGCLFVTTAVESLDDAVLARLDKGHTRTDFLEVVERFREIGLALQPTFVPFTPWTTLAGYAELLAILRDAGLAGNVAPVQLGIRLLIPAGSRLLELEDVRALVEPFDQAALVFPWRHPDPRVDELCREVQARVQSSEKLGRPRARIFARIEEAVRAAQGIAAPRLPAEPVLPARLRASAPGPGSQSDALDPAPARATVPYLNEPWYC
jgi:Radical SAM superfamily